MSGIVGSYFNTRGSGIVAKLGTDGQVFTSTGAGLSQGFEAAGGGAWNLLETITASDDATIDFESGIDGTYQNYAILFSGLVPASNDTQIFFRVTTDSGSSYEEGTNYRYSTHGLTDNGTEGLTGSTGDDKILLAGKTFGTGTGANGLGTIYIGQPSNSSYFTVVSALIASADNADRSAIGHTGGIYKATTAVDGFRLLMNSGNIALGVFKLYGIS